MNDAVPSPPPAAIPLEGSVPAEPAKVDRIAAALKSLDAREPASAPSAPVPSTVPVEAAEAPADAEQAPAEGTPAPGELSSAERRQAWLEKSRAGRKANEREKAARQAEERLRDTASRAEYVQRAVQDWERDPRAVVKNLGLDPMAYERKLFEQRLQSPHEEPDPATAAAQQVMAPVVEEIRQMRAQEQQRAEIMEYSAWVARDVLPAVSDPDKCELLLHVHGGDAKRAAVYLANEIRGLHQSTGRLMSPAEAAEAIEGALLEQETKRIEGARKVRKLAGRFEPAPPAAPPPAAPKTRTLTAAHGPGTATTARERPMTRAERLDAIMAKAEAGTKR